MNRAEIRRQKREAAKADKIYHITKAQLDKIVADATDKTLDKMMLDRLEQNITVMMSLPLVSLHDRFGFGEKRIKELLDDMMVKWDCMNEDYLAKRRDGYSFDTFVKILKDEGVIDIIAYLNERMKDR